MTSSGKPGLVPKLRFPEFREAGDWKERQLGAFLSESRLPGSKGDVAKKITVKLWGNGVFAKNEALQGSVNTQYFRRKSGQFIYSKLDFLNQAFGIIPPSLDNFESTVDLPCFDIADGLNSVFLLEYVKRRDFYEKLGETADGSRKARRIHAETFLSFSIALPTPAEQQKIADCLASLDELLTLEAQQLDTLKTHKKGLMQQLFPAEGETLPKLRFPEFRDAGVWEEKRLGDVGNVRMCKRILKEQTSPRGDIPFYKIGTFGGVPDAYIPREIFENFRNSYPFPKNGAVLISAAGTIGRTVRYNGELAYFQDSNIVWLDNSEKLIADNFLFYLYQLIDWSPSVGAIQRLYNENILGAQVKFPSIPEQQNIADCLASLDDLITAQTQKLAALKTHKKGLMQQLFPTLDEVAG